MTRYFRFVAAATCAVLLLTAQAWAQQTSGAIVPSGARVTLPIELVEVPTEIVPVWSGAIEHIRGELRKREHVSLKVTDCQKSAATIIWHAENTDGLDPAPRGSLGTCESRWALRDNGEHRFWISYGLRYYDRLSGSYTLGTEQKGPESIYDVASSGWQSARDAALAAAVTAVVAAGVTRWVDGDWNNARKIAGIGGSGAFLLTMARLEW